MIINKSDIVENNGCQYLKKYIIVYTLLFSFIITSFRNNVVYAFDKFWSFNGGQVQLEFTYDESFSYNRFHIELNDYYTGYIDLNFTYANNIAHNLKHWYIIADGSRIGVGLNTSGKLRLLFDKPVNYIDVYMTYHGAPSSDLDSSYYRFDITSVTANITLSSDTVYDRLYDIYTCVDGVETSLRSIASDMGNVETDVDLISTRVTNMEYDLTAIQGYLNNYDTNIIDIINDQLQVQRQILSVLQNINSGNNEVTASSVYCNFTGDFLLSNSSTYYNRKNFNFLDGTGSDFTLSSDGIVCNQDGYVMGWSRVYYNCPASQGFVNCQARFNVNGSGLSPSYASIYFYINGQLPLLCLFEVQAGDIITIDVQSTVGGYVTLKQNSNFLFQYMSTDSSDAQLNMSGSILSALQRFNADFGIAMDGISEVLGGDTIDIQDMGVSVTNYELINQAIDLILQNLNNEFQTYQVPVEDISIRDEMVAPANLFNNVFNNMIVDSGLKSMFVFLLVTILLLAMLG